MSNKTIGQNRRDFLRLLVGGGIGSAVLSGLPEVASATGVNSWHRLTQTDRNQRIINTAYQDLGRRRGQCKTWIQEVVLRASQVHVPLPLNATSPNNWYWESDPYNHAIGMSMRLENVPVGNIIQMRLQNGTPHTAIVAGRTRDGVTFLESNRHNNDETVRLEPITYKKFYGDLGPARLFSVYYIL